MVDKYEIKWTRESKDQTDKIIAYLLKNWSEKECKDFLDLLLHFEKTISLFPKTFKASSKYKVCRLGLVHKHITAVYKISYRSIIILTILDNRSEKEK